MERKFYDNLVKEFHSKYETMEETLKKFRLNKVYPLHLCKWWSKTLNIFLASVVLSFFFKTLARFTLAAATMVVARRLYLSYILAIKETVFKILHIYRLM